MDNKELKMNSKTGNGEKTEQTLTISNDVIRRRRNNIRLMQNVLLIWLDSNVDDGPVDCLNDANQLRHMVNNINIFTDPDECVDFLDDMGDKVCLIISGSLRQHTVSCIHDMFQVDSIFIFCSDKKDDKQWTKDCPKIKGVFAEITDLYGAVKQATHQCEQNAISISFMDTTSDISNKKLDQLEPSFMYTQIMKEIILTIEFGQQHFQEFIDYCSEVLAENPIQLQNVEKLKQTYRQRSPVWWYTYECLLYPLLNRALRTLDANLIVKLGFFIKDLHLQIEQLYNEQSDNHKSDSLTIYRGQGMVKEEFEKMIKAKGGLLSFNCFLSTSRNREVARLFAESVTANPDLIGVLFVMTINTSQPTTPFATIGNVSYYKNQEEEVLFSMHTVFRIENIILMDENQRLFQVNLTLTNDNDPDLHILTNRIREETFPDDDGWTRLGLVLLKIGQSKKAEEVYQILLGQSTTEKEKAFIYHQIAHAKEANGAYEETVIYHEKAFEIYKRILPPRHLGFAVIYKSFGNVYGKMGRYPKALSFYEKSLAIEQLHLPSNHLDLAMSYDNIGLVCTSMREDSKALSFHEKALEVFQKTLPSNHPDLAFCHQNMGIVYQNMQEYSKALTSFEKALVIQHQSLPPNHPSLAAVYNCIAAVYYEKKEHWKALSFFEKTLAIRQQLLPLNHPDLATTYTNIGLIYYKLGEDSKALSFSDKALAIQEQSPALNRPGLAATYNNMGLMYHRMGEYSKALLYHERAFEIWQQSLSPNHPQLATSYRNVGNVYNDMNEYSKALRFYEKALAIEQQSLPPNDPNLALHYNSIGFLYQEVGESSRALSSHQTALKMQQQSLPPYHENLVYSYNGIGSAYEDMGEYSKALSSYEKALAIKQQSSIPDDPILATCYGNLGKVYYKMGERSIALSYHKKALEIDEKTLSPNHPDLAASYNNIGLVYESLGELWKASSFLEKALCTEQRSLPASSPVLQQRQKALNRVKKKLLDMVLFAD